MPLSILEAHEWEGDDIYASQLTHEDVGVELNSLDTGYPGNLQADADARIPKENGGNPVIRRCTDLDRAVSECLFAIRDFVGDAGCEVEVESFLNFWSTGRDTWLLSVRWPPPEGRLIDPSKKSVERHRDRSTPVVEDIRHRPLLTVVDERSQIGLILRGIQL